MRLGKKVLQSVVMIALLVTSITGIASASTSQSNKLGVSLEIGQVTHYYINGKRTHGFSGNRFNLDQRNKLINVKAEAMLGTMPIGVLSEASIMFWFIPFKTTGLSIAPTVGYKSNFVEIGRYPDPDRFSQTAKGWTVGLEVGDFSQDYGLQGGVYWMPFPRAVLNGIAKIVQHQLSWQIGYTTPASQLFQLHAAIRSNFVHSLPEELLWFDNQIKTIPETQLWITKCSFGLVARF